MLIMGHFDNFRQCMSNEATLEFVLTRSIILKTS